MNLQKTGRMFCTESAMQTPSRRALGGRLWLGRETGQQVPHLVQATGIPGAGRVNKAKWPQPPGSRKAGPRRPSAQRWQGHLRPARGPLGRTPHTTSLCLQLQGTRPLADELVLLFITSPDNRARRRGRVD